MRREDVPEQQGYRMPFRTSRSDEVEVEQTQSQSRPNDARPSNLGFSFARATPLWPLSAGSGRSTAGPVTLDAVVRSRSGQRGLARWEGTRTRRDRAVDPPRWRGFPTGSVRPLASSGSTGFDWLASAAFRPLFPLDVHGKWMQWPGMTTTSSSRRRPTARRAEEAMRPRDRPAKRPKPPRPARTEPAAHLPHPSTRLDDTPEAR